MKAYELTYIISSQITSDEAENVKKGTETFIQSKGGVILKSEKSVPQSLAYPIKKQSSGYFAILEFQAPENTLKEIRAKIQKDTNILRSFIVIKHPPKKMKERRMKRPIAADHKIKSKSETSEVFKEKAKKEDVKPEDIDKKLEEILG